MGHQPDGTLLTRSWFQRFAGSPWLIALGLSVGVLGMVAVWTSISVLSQKFNGWIALIAAVDFAFLLRLTGALPGSNRMSLAAAATLLTIIGSAWMIVASRFGMMMGLAPIESAMRVGPVLAWELTKISATTLDAVFVCGAPVLAAALCYERSDRQT